MASGTRTRPSGSASSTNGRPLSKHVKSASLSQGVLELPDVGGRARILGQAINAGEVHGSRLEQRLPVDALQPVAERQHARLRQVQQLAEIGMDQTDAAISADAPRDFFRVSSGGAVEIHDDAAIGGGRRGGAACARRRRSSPPLRTASPRA